MNGYNKEFSDKWKATKANQAAANRLTKAVLPVGDFIRLSKGEYDYRSFKIYNCATGRWRIAGKHNHPYLQVLFYSRGSAALAVDGFLRRQKLDSNPHG